MKKILFTLLLVVAFASTAFAVPTLQVGVRDIINGGWLLNTNNLTNPTEEDTVVTSGSAISVAAVYGNGDRLIGGQYLSNGDWSSFHDGNNNDPNYPTAFDGKGAILVASVANGGLPLAANLTINGSAAFYTDISSSWFPNSHAPAQGVSSDFLFFDVGSFDMSANETVPDFQASGSGVGDIMDLALSGMGDLAWIHFDIMAIITGANGNSGLVANIDGNPGSHDVTWKNPGGGGGGQGSPVPEPSTLILLGAGIAGLAIFRRKKG